MRRKRLLDASGGHTTDTGKCFVTLKPPTRLPQQTGRLENAVCREPFLHLSPLNARSTLGPRREARVEPSAFEMSR